MKEGWLWLSILKTTAIAVADIDHAGILARPLDDPRRLWSAACAAMFFEDLYEQCSFHMAEKMPSSVKLGSRPISSRMRWYSSGFRPCAATSFALTRRTAVALFCRSGWTTAIHASARVLVSSRALRKLVQASLVCWDFGVSSPPFAIAWMPCVWRSCVWRSCPFWLR